MLAREVLLREQRVLARALDDPEQVGHRRDLLDLLPDEPLHELLRGVVLLLAGDRRERVDLLRDPPLLRERERDGRHDVLERGLDRKSTRLNSSHLGISYAVFCLKKKKKKNKFRLYEKTKKNTKKTKI